MGNKINIAIIGATGRIGKIVASRLESIWGSGRIGEIYLIGRNADKLDAIHRETLSATILAHARRPKEMFDLSKPKIHTELNPGKDNVDIVFVTASAKLNPDEKTGEVNRDDLFRDNARIFENDITSALADIINRQRYQPYIVNVSNPVDSLTTYMYERLSELCDLEISPAKFCASGGVIDSCRAKYITAEAMGHGYNDVDATAVGEHGDNMIVPANSLYLYGVPIAHTVKLDLKSEIQGRTKAEGIRIMLEAGDSPAIGPAEEMLTIAKYFDDAKSAGYNGQPLPVHGYHPEHKVFIGGLFEFHRDGLQFADKAKQPELTNSEKVVYEKAVGKIRQQVKDLYSENGLSSLDRGRV